VGINRTAQQGFAAAADAYEDGRPDYPAPAIDWLAAELRLGRGRTVVDLAAGTGKLTRLLTPTGAAVIAVEPVDEMRDALRRTTPDADARPGTAERTGLPDSSADALTVAQAFHWFDGPAALAEIHRVLRPGGTLAVVYNVRDLTDPTQHAVDDLVSAYRGDTPSHRSGRWRADLDATSLFHRANQRAFPNAQTIDADGLVDRVASVSFIAELPATEHRRVLDRARAIAAGLPERFQFPYTTEIDILDRR
jgi:ubiquinone/menaquinone biosynthesis C-methylase UbiE